MRKEKARYVELLKQDEGFKFSYRFCRYGFGMAEKLKVCLDARL